MRIFVSLLFALLFTKSILVAQEAPSPIYIAPDAPDWMLMLQQDTPNANDIAAAYKNWYQTHPFEKNNYTQYYKRWVHWARPFIQSDGSIRMPDEKTRIEQEQHVAVLRNNTPENLLGNWSFVGPKQTYDIDGTTEVTWQTNIYSVDIAPSNTNIVYAAGETGGLWKTTDKGLNWTLLTKEIIHGSVTAVKVDPTDPNTVFMCTNSRIYKTINGGTTWTQVYTASGLNVYDFAFKTDDPTIVLAASNKGLLRTNNSGTTWSTLFTNETWTVKVQPGTSSTFFAIRKNGSGSDLMLSTNSGSTFATSNTGWWTPGAGEVVTGALLAVCPSQPSKLYAYLCGSGSNLAGYIGVFVSTNDGASWANTNPAGSIGNSPTLYSIPAHTNLMTSNGTTGLEQGFYDMAIIVNPNNANQLIAGGTSWFKSTNGGATWTGLGGYQSGLPWSHPDIQSLSAIGNDLWIASDGGLNYSTNFGTSHQARMNGISGADLWGFDSGWNEDVLVGGRYHNGNMAWHEVFPSGKFYRMGGAESPTGYVNPGDNRKTYFSDIGGKRLKGGFNDGVVNFPVGLFPNESYAYYANSEMVWDPRCWNTVYLGNDNKIWKSVDGGGSFSALYTFPGTATNEVYEIEVARSNPNVLYCSQWDGTDDKMWKSTNGGASWTALAALPLPNNNDRVKMAVSDANENILWVAVTYGSNGKKIYKSTDGGTSWVNLTTTTLNGFRITNIMAQYGTDGGIYLGTDLGVFYRNNTLPDWVSFSTGLPYSIETNRLKPFYKTGKIRNGTWGHGVWESDLYEPSLPSAQAIASTLDARCPRDTVYFDDYSVVNHTGASWSWAFSPAPAYVSATTVRNPKVIFSTPGTYTATMTLNGTMTSILTIEVGNDCLADTIPGKSVAMGGNAAAGYVSIPPLNISTNQLTISTWIKISGTQPEYSSIFMHDGESAGFNFLPNTNRLGYHWTNGAYWWDSGLTVPTDTWTHVAMVVEPTGVTLYVNGKGNKHTFTAPAILFNNIARLASYKGWGDRYMLGKMDEVCIFNNALTQAQIRELMHLTKDPAEFPNLIAYYQFNEASGQALDKIGIRHASLVSNTIREVSTAPVGKGTSARQNVTTNNIYTFGQTGITLDFPASGPYPNGELCVTRINQLPDQVPSGGGAYGNGYWIVNNYGSNSTFAALDEMEVIHYGFISPSAVPSNFQLYKRSSFAEGNTWGGSIDNADAIVPGALGNLTFNTGNGITSFSQFMAGYSGPLPVEWLDFTATKAGEQQAQLRWKVNQTSDVATFEVERSADGIQFEQFENIAAKLGASIQTYDCKDNTPHNGVNYYRIRQLDRDGKVTISPVRQVSFGPKEQAWLLYPNPLEDGQNLTIKTDMEDNYRFILYDVNGKKLKEWSLNGTATIVLPELAHGMYAYALIGSTRRVSGVLVR